MSRAVVILTVTSLGFAGSTAFLAHRLHSARRDLVAARTAPAPATPSVSSETRASASAAAPAAMAPPGSAETVQRSDVRKQRLSEEEMVAASRKEQRALDAYMPARPHDPDKRAQETREIRRSYERDFSGLPLYLDLTEDEFNRLLDIVSEQEMRNRDMSSLCAPSAGCDIMSLAATQRQTNRRQLAEFMGTEKAQRYRDYIDNFAEREAVANFRGRLPDDLRLTDTQAVKLTAVLGEERRRMQKEWEQLGTRIAGMQGQYGSIFYPVTAQGIEQRVAETSEYLRRQRKRAAEVLTTGQLEAFAQRQQDVLEEARGMWESEISQADKQAARQR